MDGGREDIKFSPRSSLSILNNINQGYEHFHRNCKHFFQNVELTEIISKLRIFCSKLQTFVRNDKHSLAIHIFFEITNILFKITNILFKIKNMLLNTMIIFSYQISSSNKMIVISRFFRKFDITNKNLGYFLNVPID